IGNVFSDMPNLVIWAHDDENCAYVSLSASDVLRSGVMYKLLTGTTSNVNVVFEGCYPTGMYSFYKCGYDYYCGNFYPVDLPLTNFEMENEVSAYYRGYIGGRWRSLTSTVAPGVAVQARHPQPSGMLFINPLAPVPAGDSGQDDTSEWLIDVSVGSDNLVGDVSRMGVSKQAKSGYDRAEDTAKLTEAEAKFVRIGFPHDWRETEAVLFQQDIRGDISG
ncbi:MAG: hypothetical protein GY869_26545, partial [Planctomycetes bacterium]|nr:hypothetical protein [Planctomycetota bacterium]